VPNYHLSEEALTDLDKMWNYTEEQWSIDQANRYVTEVYSCIEFLAENPLSGKQTKTQVTNSRQFQVESHLIFYLKEGKSITILRIILINADYLGYI